LKEQKVLLYRVHIRISKHKRQHRKRTMGEKSKGEFKYGIFERVNKRQTYAVLTQILLYKKKGSLSGVWHFDLPYFSQFVFVSKHLPLK